MIAKSPAILIASALLVLLAACRGLPPGVPGSYKPEEVPGALTEVDEELVTGEYEKALARARIASETRGLTPEQRMAVQVRVENAAVARIDQLTREGKRPKKLERIFDLELPRQLSVSAGIEAAKLYFREKNERMKAYRMVREVDSKYPQHQLRQRGAALLYEIGTSLLEDKGRYFLFFRYRNLAPEVYEYLVLNHPEEPRGDIVYRRLADFYEADGRWLLAIERNEDLVLWHPRSPLVPAARARIPNLRLEFLKSPEYDRSLLELARDELEAWLVEFEALAADEPELFEQVQLDLVDAWQRLADSDLAIARFYITVGNRFGAELHTQRAIREATAAGDEEQLEEARALLAKIERLVESDRRLQGETEDVTPEEERDGFDVPIDENR